MRTTVWRWLCTTALLINEVEIEEMQVVEKSYPYFWEDLKKAGFDVSIK